MQFKQFVGMSFCQSTFGVLSNPPENVSFLCVAFLQIYLYYCISVFYACVFFIWLGPTHYAVSYHGWPAWWSFFCCSIPSYPSWQINCLYPRISSLELCITRRLGRAEHGNLAGCVTAGRRRRDAAIGPAAAAARPIIVKLPEGCG